jgi:opacity protein-like surface antigen
MKKIFFALSIASSLFVTGQAVAGTENFEGASVGIDMNLNSATNKFVSGATSISFGESSVGGTLKAAYGLKVADKTVISLGGTYSLSDLKAGTVISGGTTTSIKGKNLWAIYLEPGLTVTDSTLVYVKAGYASMKGEVSQNAVSVSTDFNGYMYGAGIRTMIDKNLYFQVEALQLSLNSKNFSGVTVEPSGTAANIGLGYKF